MMAQEQFAPFAEPPPKRAAPRWVLIFVALLVAACVTTWVVLDEQQPTPQESQLPDPTDVAQVFQKRADEEAAEAFALQAKKETKMAMLQKASELASKGNLQAGFDKHVASPAAKMSFVKHEKLLEEAAQLEAAAQTILHGKEGDDVMPDSFRVVDERLAAERAAFHNSQSHHKGRRLLGRKKPKTADDDSSKKSPTELPWRRRGNKGRNCLAKAWKRPAHKCSWYKKYCATRPTLRTCCPKTCSKAGAAVQAKKAKETANKERANKKLRALPSRKVSKTKARQGKGNKDVLQEFFSSSTDCKAAKGGTVKTVALKKGGGWTFIGGWKHDWGGRSRDLRGPGIFVYFIFLRLSSPQKPCKVYRPACRLHPNKCKGDPSGVCMDLRAKSHYSTAWAADRALKKARKNPQEVHSKRMRPGQVTGFPKRIGSVGQCFAKCKHVPWYNMSERTQKEWSMREIMSCNTARALWCKTDGGKKTGYIDWKTNKWRTCQ